MYFAEYDSPVGRLRLRSNGRALTGIWFEGEACATREDAVLTAVKRWLEDYFRGVDRAPDFLLEPEGTVFQRQVWQILQQISYGETVTYGEIAREMAGRLGKATMSAQAVGQAVGKNPISIVIPCHRCVGTKGRLTGYAWGIERKQWLLDHEKS